MALKNETSVESALSNLSSIIPEISSGLRKKGFM